MDDKARLSLDMIIGVSIFLFVFIYVAQFLPSVFADVRSEISLAHEAYKVAVMLAEDPGRWDNGSMNGTGWESYWNQSEYPDVVFRPGLAFSKDTPNYLSYNKIKAFQRAVDQNYTRIKEFLGLKTPDNNYEFNISLQTLDSRSYKVNYIINVTTNQSILLAGKQIPKTQISRFERIVKIENNTDTYSNLIPQTRITGDITAKLVVVVWQ